MGLTLTILDDVRKQIAASDDSLKEVRRRRDLVLNVASRFTGALRTFGSGSVAAGLVNNPVSDADGGMVVDRRVYTTLGPDSDDEDPPDDLVEAVRTWVGDELRAEIGDDYPDLTVRRMKRGIKVLFGAPINEDEDPYVDLVVALTRKSGDGLWIPKILSSGSSWTASHPEKHRDLLLAGPDDVRRVRARVIRLAKEWKQPFDPAGICSFNLAALAWEIVTGAMSLDEALVTFFEKSAESLRKGLTQDPAGVSDPIRVGEPGRDIVVKRLERAAENVGRALGHDDDEDMVREALHAVFPNRVDAPSHSEKSALVSALGVSTAATGVSSTGGLTTAARASTPLKNTRSYGDGS
jgi:hypothetical protein